MMVSLKGWRKNESSIQKVSPMLDKTQNLNDILEITYKEM